MIIHVPKDSTKDISWKQASTTASIRQLRQPSTNLPQADDTENSQEAPELKITARTSDGSLRVMVSPSTSHFEDEVEAGEEGAVHQQRSRGTPPHASFQLLAARKDFPRAKQ